MLRSSLLILILFHLLACVFNSVQANNFTVSGGNNSPPFYQFTDENNQPLEVNITREQNYCTDCLCERLRDDAGNVTAFIENDVELIGVSCNRG